MGDIFQDYLAGKVVDQRAVMEAMEQRVKEQEALLEQRYPEQIRELARLVQGEESVVEAKIDYMTRTSSQSKYVIVDTLLTYHRIKW